MNGCTRACIMNFLVLLYKLHHQSPFSQDFAPNEYCMVSKPEKFTDRDSLRMRRSYAKQMRIRKGLRNLEKRLIRTLKEQTNKIPSFIYHGPYERLSYLLNLVSVEGGPPW